MVRIRTIAFLVFLGGLMLTGSAGAQDITHLQSGVVKITAQVEGKTRVATGFIVRLENNAAYIVTAAHVVVGDSQPQVEFFTKQHVQVSAQVINVEGQEDTSLALLLVQGKDNIPTGLTALPLATGVLSEGDEFLIIGHPRGIGDWATLGGKVAKRKGRTFVIDANVEEGNSGGPMIKGEEVVRLVANRSRYGLAVTAGSLRDYLEGHKISAQNSTAPSMSSVEERVLKGSSSGASVVFGGPPYCLYKMTLREISMEISVESSKRTKTGNISATATEQGLDKCPHPPISSNRHRYYLASASGSMEEGQVTLDFSPGDENSPKARATFKGTNVESKLSGTITIQRIDAASPLNWSVDIPISLEQSTPITTPKVLRGALEQEIIGKDGAPMVLIPAGEFLYGGKNQPVSLAAFYMDKFEVTTALYAAFMEATGRVAPKWWSEVSQVNDGDRPVIGVTWHDADTYCRHYGKRLPTEQEWEKAARGTDGRTYPWGNEEPNPSLAKYGKLSWEGYSTLATVKSYEGGKSPYGIYNMAGNVWEWTSSDHEKEGIKVLRGGSWSAQGTDLRSADRERGLPRGSGYRIGFRCVQDAK